MSSTDLHYRPTRATRCPVLTYDCYYPPSPLAYAISGTDPCYGANPPPDRPTRCPVLSYAMVLPAR
eukprot:3485067-Rhodomonas_salina.1